MRAPTSIKLTHLSSSSQFASNMKTFCIATILATASAAKSAMRGTPEIVDLAAASKGTRTSGVHETSNGKNKGDFDATVRAVKIWTTSDPVGVTIDGGDGSSDKHYMVKETCMKGFSGLNCQINDNDCIDVETGAPLCLHKSTCTDGIASFNCDCTDTGHEDATCSSPSKCIRGGGVIPGTYGCSELHGTITGVTGFCGCTCDAGWMGQDCSTAMQCTIGFDGVDGTKACEHGSTITGVTDFCGCDCATGPGYEHGSATNCEVHSACTYGDAGVAGTIECADPGTGTISGVTGSCLCTCDQGFRGGDCATPSICIRGDAGLAGTMKCDAAHGILSGRTVPGCACTCKDGYEGADCSIASKCTADTNGKDGTIECVSTGTVFGVTGSCGCKCDAGYEGADCGTASKCIIDNKGVPGTVDCSNGGKATGVTGNCGCDCTTAELHEGPLCKIISDDCIDHTTKLAKCRNNGVCTDGAQSFTCACAGTGYEGFDCSTASKCINSNSGLIGHFDCKNGGAVTGVTNWCGCNCLVADGYEGTHCGVPSKWQQMLRQL